jgi:hypothetical protein
MHWNHFVGALDIEGGFSTHDSSPSSEESNIGTFLFNFLGFRFFSWLSLNNLLHLTSLACAPALASYATFTGVSAKTAPSRLFCLRLFLSASAFGKGLIAYRDE